MLFVCLCNAPPGAVRYYILNLTYTFHTCIFEGIFFFFYNLYLLSGSESIFLVNNYTEVIIINTTTVSFLSKYKHKIYIKSSADPSPYITSLLPASASIIS